MSDECITEVGRPDVAAQAALVAALVDARLPVPAGLVAWNRSDPRPRWAVHRNNFMHSLVEVLSDSCPVVRQLVGDDSFEAMARKFIRAHPPRTPLMHRYAERFPDWLARFEPAAELPYLSDIARLETSRLAALYAADARPLARQTLERTLKEPSRLALCGLVAHPSLSVLKSAHPVASLWSAHQLDDASRDSCLGALDLCSAQSVLTFRVEDDVHVLEIAPADAGLAAELVGGSTLGQALNRQPDADLTRLLTVFLRNGLITGLSEPEAE